MKVTQAIFVETDGSLDPDARRHVVDNVASLRRRVGSICGLALILGDDTLNDWGLWRERGFLPAESDRRIGMQLERSAAVYRAQVLAHDLARAHMRAEILLEPGMSYTDQSGVGTLHAVTPRGIRKVHEQERLAIVAGGAGAHADADIALVEHIQNYAAAFPDLTVSAIKPPAWWEISSDERCWLDPDLARYARVSAETVLSMSLQNRPFDLRALELLAEGDPNLSVRVYAGRESLGDAYANQLGTLIVAQAGVAVFASGLSP